MERLGKRHRRQSREGSGELAGKRTNFKCAGAHQSQREPPRFQPTRSNTNRGCSGGCVSRKCLASASRWIREVESSRERLGAVSVFLGPPRIGAPRGWV